MLNKLLKRKTNKKVVLKRDEHVHHDWAIAIVVFFLAILIIAGLSGYVFMQIEISEDIVIEDTSRGDIVDADLLEETLNLYDEKEMRYEKYQRAVPSAPEL